MNPLSWSSLFLTFITSGLLVFAKPHRRSMILGCTNVAAALALMGPTSPLAFCFALTTVESLFVLLARHQTEQNRSSLGGMGWFGVLIALAPFIAFLGLNRTSYTLGDAAIFAFFSLQIAGAFFTIWLGGAPVPESRWHWYSFALFFPSLLTGPILSWKQFQLQLKNSRPFGLESGADSLRLLARGLFKRIVFAAPFYLMINYAVKKSLIPNLIVLLVFASGIRFAIWADISAHTDWSRGLAGLLGFEIPENFNRPFQTTSIVEFWRRWHMSLTRWIQDFVYFPIVSSREVRRLPRAVVIGIGVLMSFVFLGLWHGLTWTLFTMGLWKGIGVLVGFFVLKSFPRVYRPFSPLLLTVFVVLPTALLKIDATTVLGLLNVSSIEPERLTIQIVRLSTPLVSYSSDPNPIGWILALSMIWQIYEWADSKGIRLAPLCEAVILILIAVFLGTFNLDPRFIYAQIGQ